jgi:hypothetical protein
LLGRQKGFVVCERRPKALPLESAAFEKAGETLFARFYKSSLKLITTAPKLSERMLFSL